MVQRAVVLLSKSLFRPVDLGRYADNCAMLGLKSTANTKAIKNAYFTLSKRLHPSVCGDLSQRQFQTIYEAYNELMYSNNPLQFGNFPETSASCTSYLRNHISSEEAFVEMCIEYDADLKEFRELEKVFEEAIESQRDSQSAENHLRDLKQLDRFRKKFAFLHLRFDQLHDCICAIRRTESYPNCSLEALTSFAEHKKRFWNAQNGYVHAQKELLAYMKEEKEQKEVMMCQH